MTILLRGGLVGLTGRAESVFVRDGRIEGVGAEADARAGSAEVVVDLDGRTVLPGLWDHHVHLDQLATAQQSLDLEGAASADEVVARVRQRLATAPPDPGQPLIGYGFRAALWSRPPDSRQLDAVSSEVALIMVSGDLHQGWLNTAARRRFEVPETPDGLIAEHAWFPVLERIRTVGVDVRDRWVAATTRQAASRGVVGVVDFEKTDPLAPWPRRHARDPLALRIRVGVWPEHLERVIDAGLRSGDQLAGTDGLVTIGNLKVISDGSLNTRTAYCHDPYPVVAGERPTRGQLEVPTERLVPLMERAWAHGIGCSIHAIGDHANALVLDAFAATGAQGSIEHAQLLDDLDVARFADLGIVASVQPEHAHDDRDVADRLWAGRTGRSFPYGALHRAGVSLLLGSDAPVAPLDPLLTIAAAVDRSRDGRPPWHPEQEIPLAVALAASTATGRTEPRVGDVADLTIVDADVARASAAELRTAAVAGTLVGGDWTHRAGI